MTMTTATYLRDAWPKMPDGRDYDGTNLLRLVIDNKSPFDGLWDVKKLFKEVEQNFRARIVDVPSVTRGSSNCVCYGIHIKLHNQPDILARLSRIDINMPNYSGASPDVRVSAARFESGVYKLLRAEHGIPVSPLLYYRPSIFDAGKAQSQAQNPPKDLSGRALFVFRRPTGRCGRDVWDALSGEQRDTLLAQCATFRAALFNITPPRGFTTFWVKERLFGQNASSISVPVTPSRDFCIALFEAKIYDTFGSQHSPTPAVAATKTLLLDLLPQILPEEDEEGGDEPTLYRFVLEHGDFGLHNMSVAHDSKTGKVSVTSVHDWKTGHLVPALLADPRLGVDVNLSVDEDVKPGAPCFSENATAADKEEYLGLARTYLEALFRQSQDFKRAIETGRHARYLWATLKDWRVEDAAESCANLSRWAEEVKRTSSLEAS